MKQVVQAVLDFLGLGAFAKDMKGKSILLSTQEAELTQKYGEKFVAGFKTDLAALEADGKSVEEILSAASTAAEDAKAAAENLKLLTDAKARIKALEAEKVGFEAQIAAMSKEETGDQGVKVETQGEMAKVKFVPDMKLGVNQRLNAQHFGLPDARTYTGDSTVDTTEIQQEFGRYVQAEKMEIFRSLLGATTSTAYMTTMITDKFEVRAMHSHITSVLQSFTPKWTPKGSAKFTPLTIKQFPMKLNVSIIPSDVIDEVLGYLYDESLEPKDMPIVRYIIEQLVRPILDQEREIAMAKGRYTEPVAEDGSFKPNDANQVMDGYLTQLVDLKVEGKKPVTWLLPGVALGTGATLLANVDKAVDAVAPLYKSKVLTIHADPDLIRDYSRAYRDKYPTTKNEDGEKVKVDFTNFTFAGLEGMRGTGAFFITPKENFRHLMSRDPKNLSLRMATQDYEAKIYGEWREGVGFWLAEAIFAYLPDSLIAELSEAEVVIEQGGDGDGI